MVDDVPTMKTNKAKSLPWTVAEDRAIIADYLANRDAQLRGEKVNKAETLRALLPKLNGRSRGSVEFKRCNVSAALERLGQPIWPGYKPRFNYQIGLVDVVCSMLAE